jgi:LysR family glycine cleavage system transcriptional activator
VPYAYWIVCPRATAKLPKIVRFRDWLLREAAEDQRQLAVIGHPRRRGRTGKAG